MQGFLLSRPERKQEILQEQGGRGVKSGRRGRAVKRVLAPAAPDGRRAEELAAEAEALFRWPFRAKRVLGPTPAATFGGAQTAPPVFFESKFMSVWCSAVSIFLIGLAV